MTLPTSGSLSLNDIQTEFGGSNPIGLNEYYAGGSYVPAGTSGTNGAVPSSGAISINNFYGTSAAYLLSNSLRFRASASAYLGNRTYGTPTNQLKFTWSAWVKRGSIGTNGTLWGVGTVVQNFGNLFFDGTDNLHMYYPASGSPYWEIQSNAVFRDPAAWYHIVVAYDTTQATDTNRIKMWVNNQQITTWTTAVWPTLNYGSGFNANGYPARLFQAPVNSGSFLFDGEVAEHYFVDGQALTPSSFGAYNSNLGNMWQPVSYTGTYGNNGYYLKFTDTSGGTSGANSGLGKDFSGNGNYYNTNNISLTAGSTYDSMLDVPTNTSATAANYAVLNPTIPNTTNLINGNLTRNGSVRTNISTAAVIAGKYYFETTIQDSNGNGGIGVKQTTAYPIESYDTSKCASYFANGEYKIEGASQTSGFSSYTNGDVIGCAVDSTVSPAKIWWSKNNVWQGTGNPTTAGYSLTAGLDYYFMVLHGSGSSSTTASVNFGQQGFKYTPPSGFVALNSYNI